MNDAILYPKNWTVAPIVEDRAAIVAANKAAVVARIDVLVKKPTEKQWLISKLLTEFTMLNWDEVKAIVAEVDTDWNPPTAAEPILEE